MLVRDLEIWQENEDGGKVSSVPTRVAPSGLGSPGQWVRGQNLNLGHQG